MVIAIKQKDLYLAEVGEKMAKRKVLAIINNDRDNGNIVGEKGFSPALCLSKIIKYCEEEKWKNLN